MAAKLIRLTHKITIQLHLVAENCTTCSSRYKWLVRKLLDTTTCTYFRLHFNSSHAPCIGIINSTNLRCTDFPMVSMARYWNLV